MKANNLLLLSLAALWLSVTSVRAESNVVTVDTSFPKTLQPNTT